MLAEQSHEHVETRGPEQWRRQPDDPREIRIASLQEVLAFHNQDILDRYCVDQNAEASRAAEVFEDVKLWLWLCAEAKRETTLGLDVPTPTIFDEQLELDEMWHTFILFTPEYVDFCFKFFGTYLHHIPTPEREKRSYDDASIETKKAGIAARAAMRRRVAAYVFDKLGEDVARRWYLQPRAA